eukprot:148425-Chlamydomonas_euryale.AAC.1
MATTTAAAAAVAATSRPGQRWTLRSSRPTSAIGCSSRWAGRRGAAWEQTRTVRGWSARRVRCGASTGRSASHRIACDASHRIACDASHRIASHVTHRIACDASHRM